MRRAKRHRNLVRILQEERQETDLDLGAHASDLRRQQLDVPLTLSAFNHAKEKRKKQTENDCRCST